MSSNRNNSAKSSPTITKETKNGPKKQPSETQLKGTEVNINGGNISAQACNKLMFDRTLWIIMNLVGKHVEVQVKNGDYYEGILSTVTTERTLGAVLRMARKKEQSGDKKKDASRPMEAFVIHPADLVQIYAKEVSFDMNKDKEFLTDADISGNVRRERTLQPWLPESGESSAALDFNLDESEEWDQFAVNKELFGVESTFDENLYTTKLDPTFYREKQLEAQRIADEIERKITSNPHILEERGAKVQDDYLDEEERYSSVIRDPASGGTKYIPPQKRALITKSSDDVKSTKQQKDKSSTSTSQPMAIPKESGSSHGTLERTESSEDVGGSSRGSPTRLSPLMSPKDGPHGNIVQERLRLRMYLVNERLKNSAPVTNQDETNQFQTQSRSPLLSPLVGDARSVNALSLEPSTPKLDETVVKEFFDFSLTQKKKDTKRDRTIAEWKSFSKTLEKKIVESTSPTGSVTTPSTGATASTSPAKSSSVPITAATTTTTTTTTTKQAEPSTPTKEVTAPTTTTPATTAATTTPSKETKPAEPTTETPKKETTTTAASSTTTTPASSTTTVSKSKLNPKAREFKPMSANAPVFSPGGGSGTSTSSNQFAQSEDDYGWYGGRPYEDPYTPAAAFAPVPRPPGPIYPPHLPYVPPPILGNPTHMYPVRMVPQTPGFYGGYAPSPVMAYPQTPTSPPAKRFGQTGAAPQVSPSPSKVGGTPPTPGSPAQYGGMAHPPGTFVPGRVMPMMPTYYPPGVMMPRQGDESISPGSSTPPSSTTPPPTNNNQKFQVPSNDSLPAPKH